MSTGSAEIPIEIDASTLDEMRTAGDQHHVLDVREPWEVATCSIANSLAIPMNEIPGRIAELTDDHPLVVMCHHGARSLQVAMWLREQGFDRATSLAGGIDAWARQIDPSVALY
jgi:rhodanese-related sulfurtransferase